jgi:hypothetical protein
MAGVCLDDGGGAGVTDTRQYLNDLDAQLARAGIRGARRERIVTELADHLSCDPEADLGDPAALVTQFADELGTSFARTAAFHAFLALLLAGILVVVRAVALVPHAGDVGTADTLSLMISAVAAQVAFVAGGLGLLRAFQVRGLRAIPREEASVLARRAGIGLTAGVVTILAFPLKQVYRDHPGAVMIGSHPTTLWWPLASAASMVVLVAAAPAVIRAARLRPQTAGPAGDLLSDLGPLQPLAERIGSGSVTRLAFIIAAGIAMATALAGVAANDPYDGILRGLLEGSVFVGGYVALGRYLGIRR